MKTFKGGVHVPDSKYLTEYLAVEQMPIVPEYFVALSQHIGAPSVALVKAGDTVTAGQPIAAAAENALSVGIHAPLGGVIKSVTDKVITLEVKEG